MPQIGRVPSKAFHCGQVRETNNAFLTQCRLRLLLAGVVPDSEISSWKTRMKMVIGKLSTQIQYGGKDGNIHFTDRQVGVLFCRPNWIPRKIRTLLLKRFRLRISSQVRKEKWRLNRICYAVCIQELIKLSHVASETEPFKLHYSPEPPSTSSDGKLRTLGAFGRGGTLGRAQDCCVDFFCSLLCRLGSTHPESLEHF